MQQILAAGKSFADVVKMGLRPRFLIIEDDEDDEPLDEMKPWDALPYNFLVSVCRYLHDRDRYQMACVCRRWREATLNPSLWRSHIFYLYCRDELPQGILWLAGRARFLQHATIMCFGTFDRHRQEFLKALQQTDLLDLDINGAAYWWSSLADTAACNRVVARIVRLIKTQRRLHGFQMRQAMLPFNTGMGVLAALLLASGTSLSRLGLEDFFGDNAAITRSTMPDKFAQVVCQFPQLRELTINYEYITDGLLKWIATHSLEKQMQLNIVSWLSSAHRPGLSQHAWTELAESPRDVRVYLILQNIRSISEVHHSILRPEIPMHRLDLVGVAALGQDESEDMRDLLRHISLSYGRTLAGLRLWSDNYMCPAIEAAVLDLLRKCPKLEYLDLHMELPCEILGILCEMQRKKLISLRTLRLARSLTNFLEFEHFRTQVKEAFPKLKNLGLDFHVRAESAPDHSARNEYVFIIADNAGIMDSEDENYINSVTQAQAVSKVPGDDHNNSNTSVARTPTHTAITAAAAAAAESASRVNRRRRHHRARQPSVAAAAGSHRGAADVRHAAGGIGRGYFEWRQYRHRRQLRSRSRRFRGI